MRPLPTRDELYAALPHSLLLRQLAVRWADERPAYALTLTRAIHERHADLGLVASVPEEAGKHLVADDGYVTYEGWAYRWTTDAPPIDAGAVQWLPEDAAGEVAAVLGRGFPDASMQVGDPAVRRWAGLRRDGRLVAVAADATAAGAPGFLASIASDPEARGTGAGKAVTAWATAELVREQRACGLWHMAGNAPAAALYTRLGFHDDARMVVVGPPE